MGCSGGLALAIVCASFLGLLDFLLSSMDRFPLFVGGDGSGAGSSERPRIDLNLPAPEPEPEPAPPVVPYPYQSNEIIGGDSVESIQQRLLRRFPSPSAHEIEFSRIQAEDLFEVKVDIIRIMASLDPSGDWVRRGARALDNPRTPTGEESLSRLHALLEDLNRDGVHSSAFKKLRSAVFSKQDPTA